MKSQDVFSRIGPNPFFDVDDAAIAAAGGEIKRLDWISARRRAIGRRHDNKAASSPCAGRSDQRTK